MALRSCEAKFREMTDVSGGGDCGQVEAEDAREIIHPEFARTNVEDVLHGKWGIRYVWVFNSPSRRGARVVDRAALEMRCTGDCTGGSNPSLSANKSIAPDAGYEGGQDMQCSKSYGVPRIADAQRRRGIDFDYGSTRDR